MDLLFINRDSSADSAMAKLQATLTQAKQQQALQNELQTLGMHARTLLDQMITSHTSMIRMLVA